MNTPQVPPADTEASLQLANQQITEAYDRRVYTSNAFWYSSPGHLRAAAYVYGLDSVPLENARVLELGCAGGGNLLPFAVSYPEAHVVGVDLSSVQIKQGQQVIQALGIQNLHLHAMSLTDIAKEFGEFDYIIAHGVFSWVPPEVREGIMSILRDHLSPNGIGYVSYNTYPGWKAGDIVRDAMLLHSHGAASDEQKLASAKAMLDLLSNGLATSNPLGPSLHSAVTNLRQYSDYYIAHEYLETFNNPCYLLEFVDMASRFRLTHVGDAEPNVEISATYGQNVQLNHSLVALGTNREMRQQYLDFAVGRNFRKSLVVHGTRASQIKTVPDLGRLVDLRWAGHFTEMTGSESKTKVAFRNDKNRSLETGEKNVEAVIRAVSRAWPASLSFSELVESVRPELHSFPQEEEVNKQVADALETLFRFNILRYTRDGAPYEDKVYEVQRIPELIPGFAYISQRRRDPLFGVGTYNLWHENVDIALNEAEQFVLEQIDGKRSRKHIVSALRDAMTKGEVLSADGVSLKGQRNLDLMADKLVGKVLGLLQRQGLLFWQPVPA